jgi:thiamine biosynthesis lipoprotein
MTPPLLYKAQTRWLFHSHIKLKLSVFYDDAIFDDLFGALEEVNLNYNSYTKGSYFDSINQNAGRFTPADSETIVVLKKLSALSDDLDGEFDITVMPLIRLWGFYKENNHSIPSTNDIELAKKNVDYKLIAIENDRVRVGEKQEIITGAFVKSFAVDKLVEKMRGMGISDAIINAGGSTIYAINDESHPSWPIQVDGAQKAGKPLFQLRISNECYSTSSSENTYLQIDGRKYSHIISPKTGYPSENVQVGIVSRSAILGDVISTGLFNFDKDSFVKKIRFLSTKYGVEGFIVDKNGEIAFSENFERYII